MQKTVNDLLREAGDIVSQRGQTYGAIENSFQLAADMATLRLGRDFHAYEVAIVLACVKNARSFAAPDHMDSHLDGSVYELFAATFAEDYVKNATAEVSYKRKPQRAEKARQAEYEDLMKKAAGDNTLLYRARLGEKAAHLSASETILAASKSKRPDESAELADKPLDF